MRTKITLICLLLSSCSVFGVMTVKEPSYQLVEEKQGYEIRNYPELVVAQTTIIGEYEDASSEAFNKLFDYINGKNSNEKKIEMTAPVGMKPEGVVLKGASEFFTQQTADGWTMSFVLPERYDIENAPRPLDPAVALVPVSAKKVAAYKFSGTFSSPNLEEAKNDFVSRLDQDGIDFDKQSVTALGYNPPWTLPMFRRNEIQVELSPN